MLKLEINDERNVNIKNDATEVNINDIQKISNISIKGYSFLKMWYEMLKVLANNDNYLYIDDDSLLEVIENINLNNYKQEYTESIEIDDVTYNLEMKEDTPKLNMKIILLLEEYINKFPEDWLKYAMAILYIKDGDNYENHYTDKEIKKRAELFDKEITGDVSFKLIWFVNVKMNKNLEKLQNIVNTSV